MQRPHQQRTAPTIEDRVMYTEQASEVIIRQFDQANTVQSALLEIEAGLLLTFLQPVQGVFPLFRRQMADVMDAPRKRPS